jgi:hypothetical protein
MGRYSKVLPEGPTFFTGLMKYSPEFGKFDILIQVDFMVYSNSIYTNTILILVCIYSSSKYQRSITIILVQH